MDPAVLARPLDAAHHAPSVGYRLPWRFLRITDLNLRRQIHALAGAERVCTAEVLGERSDALMRLEVEGILECGEPKVTALMDRARGAPPGRRTPPEMDSWAPVIAQAIQNRWLAARAEGLGLGLGVAV